MPNLLYPYLIGFVTLILVVLAALWAFILNFRRAIDYGKKEARLPMAARWEDLDHRVRDLQEQFDQIHDNVQEALGVIDEAKRQREWLDQNREDLVRMHQEREELEQVRSDLTQAHESLAAARQQLEETNRDKQGAQFELEQCQSRTNELSEKAERLTSELEREQNRLDGLRSKSEEQETQLAETRKKLAEVEESLVQQQTRLDSLKIQIKELEDRRRVLEDDLKFLEKRRSEVESEAIALETKKKTIEKENETLADHLEGLRKEARSRDRMLATMEETLAELWQPAVPVAEYPEAADDLDENEALGNVARYLKGLGLHFPERALYALHTSLKVSMDTPLLVLAGISGTGKSLLPRRYAEAMGMHFLNTPVQPRWDGPQDLFGFFNYLENRYKPTELVRALIQFDTQPRDWVPDDYLEHAGDERMLLVLLDEMNLARIEYYFSELLSRLEIRRDINVLDQAERVNAEIPLDLGGVGETHATPRVYVHNNVLFVGTMNEDESTLALSDKVVDRANVIRFGRPKRLYRNNGQADKVQVERSQVYLPYATWEQWIKTGADREAPDVAMRTVERLNEALNHIGRPFGFRTRNAIHSYVKQYPNQNEQGIRNALSDQVEQRVLPKLRGVDIAEQSGQRALNDVKQIVGDLKDDVLLAAIMDGEQAQEGHLFTWLGVDRTEDGG